jgi:hypothetical protein
MASDPQLTDEPQEEVAPFVATWAAEVLGKAAAGQAVKIMATFAEEPKHDREAKMRAEAQSVMRRQHAVWCNSIQYRKWKL